MRITLKLLIAKNLRRCSFIILVFFFSSFALLVSIYFALVQYHFSLTLSIVYLQFMFCYHKWLIQRTKWTERAHCTKLQMKIRTHKYSCSLNFFFESCFCCCCCCCNRNSIRKRKWTAAEMWTNGKASKKSIELNETSEKNKTKKKKHKCAAHKWVAYNVHECMNATNIRIISNQVDSMMAFAATNLRQNEHRTKKNQAKMNLCIWIECDK